jgi:hypothetical protein
VREPGALGSQVPRGFPISERLLLERTYGSSGSPSAARFTKFAARKSNREVRHPMRACRDGQWAGTMEISRYGPSPTFAAGCVQVWTRAGGLQRSSTPPELNHGGGGAPEHRLHSRSPPMRAGHGGVDAAARCRLRRCPASVGRRAGATQAGLRRETPPAPNGPLPPPGPGRWAPRPSRPPSAAAA